ncbi:Astra associated protein 1 Asa1 [Microsporum ferrugineum]
MAAQEPYKQSSSEPGQKLPPATPVYVLRGHTSPIHTLNFYCRNSRLISGDADGWVVVWDITSKRAIATWKAHEGSILNVTGVEVALETGMEKRIFTHGRDHKLCVWRLNEKDEAVVGNILPVDIQSDTQERGKPWLLHSLSVNALNFCGFTYCFLPSKEIQPGDAAKAGVQITSSPPQMLLAVPNALNTGGLDIFHLPSERRLCVISPDNKVNTGMVMALEMFIPSQGEEIYIISGYEDGSAMVHACRGPIDRLLAAEQESPDSPWNWELLYTNRPHSQPVLSLDISPSLEREYFITSSADAMIVKHPIPRLQPALEPDVTSVGGGVESMHLKLVNTKHSGQQGLRIRADNKIFATAGWDNRIRVYGCKSMKELAVLKWHKEGCYSIAFAKVDIESSGTKDDVIDVDSTQEAKSTTLTLKNEPRSLAEIKQRRSIKAQLTHWIAAGSKDGKISLWDIY